MPCNGAMTAPLRQENAARQVWYIFDASFARQTKLP